MNPGSILGKKYKILRTIGYGGMATIYLAEHMDNHIQYAIKVLDPKFYQDPNILQRFKREASIGKALQHPNMPTFYAFELDKGYYYIVMEYVKGYNVREYLKKHGVFSIQEAIRIISTVLETLQFAYDNGIESHRDIKPENIMIDPTTQTIKVMDFGVSRMDDSTLTTDTKIYTVKYASPEQLLPSKFPQGVTKKSDLYSLGIVLYEMLTGTLPWKGTTQVDIVEQELQYTITPPSEVDTSIPKFLSQIVMKALLPNPSQRYQTPYEMQQDLLNNSQPRISPKRAPYGIPKKNTMVYWMAAILGIFLVAGGIFLWNTMKGMHYIHVQVETTPSGSRVFVDGIIIEDVLTPTKISLSKELHNITVAKDGFLKSGSNLNLSEEKKKNIQLGFELTSIEKNQQRIDGLLFVKSLPQGAKIFIDGVYVGDTPLEEFGICSGEHSLYISKEGYLKSKPTTFHVYENIPGKELFKTSLHLILVKIPEVPKKSPKESSQKLVIQYPGTLEINTNPPGALVKINGEFVDTSPLIIQLKAMEYEISVEKMGYEGFTEKITIESNDTKEFNVSLVSKIGKPILINPVNESLDLLPPIEFTWEPSENANHYRVYITDLSTGNKVFGDNGQRVDANGFFVEGRHLKTGAKYAWMVNAFKDDLEEEWASSNQFTFSTQKEEVTIHRKPIISDVRVYFSAYNKEGVKISKDVLVYINDTYIDTLEQLSGGYVFRRNQKYKIRIGSDTYGYQSKEFFFTDYDPSTKYVSFSFQ
ncbi:MAG: serine/threonine protein kinase [Caldisericia bacterium]|nr:serine/threonine protein kinase [Caldisericia bacterium]